ncbi:autotransporter outer membrane beta-barrel domain-containing protein [Arenimonas aestuarii]
MNRIHRRDSRAFRRTVLSHALLLAFASLSQSALADDECGVANAGGQVVCDPSGPDPLPQVRYTGVTDVEVVLRSGVVVDGSAMPEGDTAVTLYGTGSLGLHAEDGTVIRAYDAWPAVDVVSDSGPVSVRVDQVYGGNIGISAGSSGDVTVWANHVEGTTAIEAFSSGGNVLVDVASARAGAYGTGVYALSEQGDVGVLAGEVRARGDFTAGIDATTYDGSVAIEAGYVMADGYAARAVLAVSYEGGDVSVDVENAASFGEGSSGIVAFAGFGDVNIRAGFVSASGNYGLGLGVYAFEGGANLDVGNVGTDGDFSRAIDVNALLDVNILNESVFTSGMYSDAISVETVGDVNIASRRVATYGNESTGIRVLTSQDISIDVDEVMTYGAGSAAVSAASYAGDVFARVGSVRTWDMSSPWYAIGLGSYLGDVTLVVDELVRSEGGYAVTLGSQMGQARILVGEGATVHGEMTAIDAAAGLGSRIDVAGTVTSNRGAVIQVAANDLGDGAADIRIGSTGLVQGWVDLTDNDDRVANAGRFLSAGTNRFGAGDDLFTNFGTLGLKAGSHEIFFEGLERLENAGRVDLVNGVAGDQLVLDGTLHGVGGTLAIDYNVISGQADTISVGAVSGTNLLDLSLVGHGSLLGIDGVRVLSSGASQQGDELVLSSASRNRGFIGFDLAFDGVDSWLLQSDLADAAYLAGAVPTAARDAWRQGVQAVTSHLDATRDHADSSGAWLQVYGGDFDGSSDFTHTLGARELAWKGSHEGLQAGLEGDFGVWRAGVTAGIGKADMDLGGNEGNELDLANAGLYARYEQDGWFAGAVLRAERISLDADWASIGLVGSGKGNVLGLQLEGGRRFAVSNVWIEPSLRLAWTDLSLPELDGANGDVRWQDGARGSGELGLSIGLAEGWKGLRPYATMAIGREFGGADRTLYDLAADDVVVHAEGGRGFGRFAAGLNWTRGRFDAYGEVDARTGDIEGNTTRVGLRVRF